MEPQARNPRVGTATKPILWFVAVLLPVAVLTASALPWKWGFAASYAATAFALQILVRTKNAEIERFAHVVVLAGGAPFAVRFFFSGALTPAGVVHVAAVAGIAIAVGYLLADLLRPSRGSSRWSSRVA